MRIKILFIALLISNFIYSQNVDSNLEKSIFNLQSGFLGIWINNETKISHNFALKSEIGLDAGLFKRNYLNNTTITFLTPVINLEPRWYYNIDKRTNKSKSTKNNSANFLTASISYHPDWFVISSQENLKVINQLSVIPKWGIRRNIANSNFNFEAGIGLGYRFYFLKQYGYSENDGEAALDLHLRVGYTFNNQK